MVANLILKQNMKQKEITDNACATRDQKIIANKIDELIDEINKLKEEKWIENFIEKTQKEG